MEEWQQEIIRKNLPTLIEKTDCSPTFLAILGPILSKDDESSLEATKEGKGKVAQAKQIYDIALTRNGAFELLREALSQTNQTGSLKVLNEGLNGNGETPVFQIGETTYPTNDNFNSLHKVIFQGNVMSLGKLFEGLDKTNIKHLHEQFLIQHNFHEDLVKSSIPGPLNYYISRRLTTRSKLNTALFKENYHDVYVIENIDLQQLSRLANERGVDLSSNQLEGLTVQFILLEYEDEFEELCKISFGRPVHFLKHKDGQFTWVKSCGSIENLQKHVSNVQTEHSENEFIEFCKNNSTPVCISDTPGMGKSVLLGSLGYQLITHQPNELVCFVVFQEFVSAVQRQKNIAKTKIEGKMVSVVIAENASKSELGRQVVREMLKSHSQTVHLICDGFDEVLPEQMKAAKRILNIIIKIKAVKLYISTRPHMRNELENILCVLGYNILPFEEKEQVQFLMNYWELQCQAQNNEKLCNFAKKCLLALNETMKDFEGEIAGIPLQCLILAEVYEKDAVKHSKPENRLTDIGAEIGARVSSIFEMYKKLFEIRTNRIVSLTQRKGFWQKSPRELESFLINAHIHAAIKLLFPDDACKFQQLLIGNAEVEVHQLYALGIIEKTENPEPVPRFFHRTFAEYLLALFVVRMLTHHHEYGWQICRRKLFLDFLINKVLATTSILEQPFESKDLGKCGKIQSASFQNPVICYFINAQLKNHQMQAPRNELWTNNVVKLCDVLAACTFHNYTYIYSLASKPKGYKKLLKPNVSKLSNLLLSAAKHSNIDLFKLVYQDIIEDLELEPTFLKFNLPTFTVTPLHIAIGRGHFSISAFLLKSNEAISRIKNGAYLIQCCVAGSNQDKEPILSFKTQIIELICGENKHWINETLPGGTLPILQSKIHFKLIETLLKFGADVKSADKDGCLLHKLAEMELDPETYHNFVKSLFHQGFNRFNLSDSKKRSALHISVERIELLPETTDLFLSNGANINAVDDEGNSVLFYAIKGGRSVRFIKLLLDCEALIGHKNETLEGILHICAKENHHQLLEYLLRSLNLDPNVCNKLGITPFLQVMATGKSFTVPLIKLLEEKGLKITNRLASQALRALLSNKYFMDWKLDTEYVPVADYLLKRGAVISIESGTNPWPLETIRKNLKNVAQVTQCSDLLLKELQKRGLLMPVLTSWDRFSNKPSLLYDYLARERRSIEHICVSLIASNQLKPFVLLKQCILSDSRGSLMFATPPAGLLELIHSKEHKIIVLRSYSAELSIIRIRDTIDPEAHIFKGVVHEIHSPKPSSLAICVCESVDLEMIGQRFSNQVICICPANDKGLDMEYKLIEDKISWEDLTNSFQNDLHNFMHLCGENIDISRLKNQPLVKFINDHKIEFLDFCNKETEMSDMHKYISSTLFQYIIPDKLVFVLNKSDGLDDIDKINHVTSKFGKDVNTLDYAIVESEEQFHEICSQSYTNVHLIELHEGCLKLRHTKGSCCEIEKFIENNTEIPKQAKHHSCIDFPICTCADHRVGCENILWNLFQFPKLNITCWVSVFDIILQIQTVSGEQVGLLDLEKKFKKLCNGFVGIQCWRNIRKALPNLHFRTGTINSWEIIELLGCTGADIKNLEQISVTTLFPHTAATLESKGSELDEKYLKAELLIKRSDLLEFKHNGLAWYFLAELFGSTDTKVPNIDNVIKDILETAIVSTKIKIVLPELTYSYWPTFLESFKFVNTKFFKFLDGLVAKYPANITAHLKRCVTKASAWKWIPACIIDDLPNLFEIILSFGMHGNAFKAVEIVGLAAKYGSLPILEKCIDQYISITGSKVQDIHWKLKDYKTNGHYPVTLMHLAAMTCNFATMVYLLREHNFQNTLDINKVHDVLRLCESNVNENNVFVAYLKETHPHLIIENHDTIIYPRFTPDVHEDLNNNIMNLGVGVLFTTNNFQNKFNYHNFISQNRRRIKSCTENRSFLG